MPSLLICSIALLWSLHLVYIGMPEIFRVLGGAIGFYFLIPIIPILTLKYKNLLKLVYSAEIFVTGLVVLNYLNWYLINTQKEYQFFSIFYIVVGPCFILLLGVLLTVHTFIPWDKVGDEKEKVQEKVPVSALVLRLGTAWFLPIVGLILYLSLVHPVLKSTRIAVLDYQMALAAIIISILFILIIARKLPFEALNYLARGVSRFNGDFVMVRKSLIIAMVLFLIFGSGHEAIYRQYWAIWIETAILFIVYLLLLFRFGKILFLPNIESRVGFHLPAVSYKKITIIALATFIIYIMTLFVGILKGWIE